MLAKQNIVVATEIHPCSPLYVAATSDLSAKEIILIATERLIVNRPELFASSCAKTVLQVCDAVRRSVDRSVDVPGHMRG